jgi:hypothetical protein
MKYSLKILLFINILLISSCAKYAPANLHAQSKTLKPEKGLGLIYVIRPKSNGGKLLKLPLNFTYNNQKIGTLWAGQYLYFKTKPMKMIFNGKNGAIVKLNVVKNKTYFIEHLTSGGVGASIGGSKPLPVTRILTEDEGRALINQSRLTGKMTLVTLTKMGAAVSTPSVPLKKKIIPASQKQSAKSRPAKIIHKAVATDSMNYNNATQLGHVTIATGSQKKRRRKAIGMIEELCSTKNIALKVGKAHHKGGATYTTMNESLNNGQLTIDFSCAY